MVKVVEGEDWGGGGGYRPVLVSASMTTGHRGQTHTSAFVCVCVCVGANSSGHPLM